MFPETMNEKLATTQLNVGWSPVVTAAITTWDGGKLMAGFGKVTGTVNKAWSYKLWGTNGTNNCGTAGNVISIVGYVKMISSVAVSHTGTTACDATSNAYVQWGWTE